MCMELISYLNHKKPGAEQGQVQVVVKARRRSWNHSWSSAIPLQWVGWFGGGGWLENWRVMLFSTQVEIVIGVELGVELGNICQE